ncbi:MAG: reverse transcriptase domain-containing protein [Aeromonas sp.]
MKKLDFCLDFTSNLVLARDCIIGSLITQKSNPEIWTLASTKVNVEEQITCLVQTAESLSASQSNTLHKIISNNAAAFAWDGTPLGRTNVVRHKIDTGDSPPLRQRPRRIPCHLKDQLSDLIDDMLKQNIIRPSDSPWAAPVVLVKKKDGSIRLCIDFRRLNQVTRRDSYPLPRIDDTLDALGGAQMFSTLDLASGYWQVEMDSVDQEKTAFVLPTGLYEFQTMPFGLVNAPATFQRLMFSVLREFIPNKCLVYLDDVIVYGRSITEHMANLNLILGKLASAGLRLRPEKCRLLQPEVSFLGHVVSQRGIRSDPEKTKTIRSWPTPSCVKDVQRFLGLASYYRRFVHGFGSIATPLNHLTEKGHVFSWTSECQHAFDTLKLKLTTAPVLAFPNLNIGAGEFILDTDASDTGIGAVLSQKDETGLERVISYASRALTKAERNYSTTRRELLALVHYIKHFRHYLLGRKFFARTDHQALRWLRNFKDPEGQVARWQEQLQEYDFECVHRPGTRHMNADALSRLHEQQINTVSCRVADASVWAQDQMSDGNFKIIYDRIQSAGVKPTKSEMADQSWETLCLWTAWPYLTMEDGILYYKHGPHYHKRIVVPHAKVSCILEQLHTELGHAGQNKMDHAARERFWWPNLRQDIAAICNSCDDCLQIKLPLAYNRAPLQPIVTGYPNQLVAADIMGPFPPTPRGNRYILVLVDHFTKWAEAIPLTNADALSTARAIFNNWVTRWGVPEQLHSDRGSNFESALLGEFCSLLRITKTRTTAYHPEGNGQVERTNRSLKNLLRFFVPTDNASDWDMELPRCLLAYRATVHGSTGFTPHRMVTGREIRLPIDLSTPHLAEEPRTVSNFAAEIQKDLYHCHQLARVHLKSAHEHQKEWYDKRIHGAPLQPNDLVYLHQPGVQPGRSAKFHRDWQGPFIIQEVLNDNL